MYHTYQAYINDGDRIFDVGAGMGRMVKFYINRAAQITATDIFQSQVDYMNERFRRYTNFNAVLWDIMKDEVGDYKGKYDTVICINVLEHLKDDNLAIQKMKELLKPGGKLISKRSIASTFYPPRSSAIIVSHYTQSKKFST